MRALIGERPNVNPIGLGNSATDIDMDSYRAGKGGGDDSSEKLDVETEIEKMEKELADDEIDEDDNDHRVNKGKPQLDMSGAEQRNGKTAARPGKSKPAGRAPKEQKKKRKLEDFAEVAEAEEVTRQKELEFAKATVEKDRVKLEVKAAETAYKMQKLQDKIAKRKERAEEKATKLRLLEFRQAHGFTTPGVAAPPKLYNGYQASSSLFQDFRNHDMVDPTHHPATSQSLSGHYYRSEGSAQLASKRYDAGSSMASYDEGHSSELPFGMHGDDGSSSPSGGTAFSDGLDAALAPFNSESFASSSGAGH
jgi:hypothetical protein